MTPKNNQNISLSALKTKTPAELAQIAETLQVLSDKKKYNKFDSYFPDEGQYPRSEYERHIAFFDAGRTHSRRAFIAGNRIGKSLAGAYEMTCHLTGRYPHWWTGKRFKKPINAWIAGLTGVQLRESVQELLFGSFAELGTGLIRREDLVDKEDKMMTWMMPGTPNCIGICLVNHISGGQSKVEFKTYEQGWEKFQGAKRDVIWLDEEPSDEKIYSECSTRTAGEAGQEGILYCTFTPLQGYSKVVLNFLPGGRMPENGVDPDAPHKYVVAAGWDHVPHLSEEWKKQQLKDYPENEREARSKGQPSMGSGQIYKIDEGFVKVKPFEIPEYWPRAYGYDFGRTTAAIWMAQDPTTKVKYVYAEYYNKTGAADYMHAQNVRSKGEWIPGVNDPSGGGKKDDGTLRVDFMRTLGMNLTPGFNAINAGIARLQHQFESGLLKIFNTCENLLAEMRTYRYDTTNPNMPAKNQDDHALDALKYVDSRFDEVAISELDADERNSDDESFSRFDNSRDDLTGY